MKRSRIGGPPPWWRRQPASHLTLIGRVVAAEPAAEVGLFIAKDEDLEGERHGGDVFKEPNGHEQPGLTADDQKGRDVYGIPRQRYGPAATKLLGESQ